MGASRRRRAPRGRVVLKSAVWVAGLAPLASLLWRVYVWDLGANPISTITNFLGDWTFRLLLATLALSPLRLVTGFAWPTTLRRLLGLFTFFYACLHFSVWIVIDQFFDWHGMAADIVKRPYITVGMLALSTLVPLAVTSTAGMIRRLGGRAWRRLHRLVYATGVAAALHFLWLAKVGRRDQYLYAALVALLLTVRGWDAARRRLRRPRLAGTVGTATLLRRWGVPLFAVLLVVGGVVRSAAAPAVARPIRDVLPNGVVLIAQEHRASDVVAIQLWLRVGGRDEAPDELGLSHYLEHMLFKGTATRPPGSIDRLVEGLGGRSNAYTSYDYTHFDVTLPAAELRTGLELLADLAVNASFPPAEIDRERQVVLEEMRLTEDDPERFLLRRLYELAYEPHPYGRPLLGTPDRIRQLTRDQLVRYYKKHYVTENMVVVVVGAVRPDEVRALTAATFGRLPAASAPRPDVPTARPLDKPRRLDVRRPEQQAYLAFAWHAAPVAERDAFAVDLVTYILGDSPSSRLNQTLREREGLVSAIDAGYGSWQKGGLVTVTSRLDPENLGAAEAGVRDVVRGVREHGVTPAERERGLVTAEANYVFDLETAEGVAKTYGEAEVTWTLADQLAYLDRLRGVTAAEIQAAAARYFRDDAAAVLRFVRDRAPDGRR